MVKWILDPCVSMCTSRQIFDVCFKRFRWESFIYISHISRYDLHIYTSNKCDEQRLCVRFPSLWLFCVSFVFMLSLSMSWHEETLTPLRTDAALKALYRQTPLPSCRTVFAFPVCQQILFFLMELWTSCSGCSFSLCWISTRVRFL